MSLRIVPIAERFADEVRRTRRDAHELVVSEAHSAPCRVCLQDARVGEAVLLCSYSPFERLVPYRTVGPVFIHAEPCTPYQPGPDVPDAIARRLVSVRAYDAAGTMVAAEVSEGRDLEALAQRLFEDPRVEVLHVHHARAGCFACRIDMDGATALRP